MDTICALSGNQACIAAGSMDSKPVLLQRKKCNRILAATIICGLAIIFVEFEAIIRTGEDIQIKFSGILDSAPADSWRKRDDGSCLGIDWNIFKCSSDLMPRPTRYLFAIKEVKPVPRRKPDVLGG